MILKQVAWMTLVGGVIGIVGAYYLGKGAESLLFEIKGYDPMVVAICGRGAGDRRLRRRLHSGLPRVARASDAGASLRVARSRTL